MKYKKLHELSDSEYQVLRNIAARNLFDIMDVQIAYVGWSRGHEVNKAIEKEFEMAFLDADTKSMHQCDEPSDDSPQKKLSEGIQRTFKTFNDNLKDTLKDTFKEKLQLLSADLAQNGLPADIKESFITCNIRRSLQNTPKVLSKPKRDLIINTDDITNLRIELNRADFSYDKFLERI